MRIGYGRAAHLIDLMEKDGIVGPPDGTRPRELLKGRELDAGIRRIAARLRIERYGLGSELFVTICERSARLSHSWRESEILAFHFEILPS